MAFVIETTDIVNGVEITADAKLAAPTLTPVSGQNELQVQWSRASGQNPATFVELRVVQSDPSQGIMNILIIQWGDGSIENYYIGSRTLDRRFTHTYTLPATSIQVEVSFKAPQVIVFSETLAVSITPSGDFRIEQVQFEKYEDDVRGLGPDWVDSAKVPATFTDGAVRRGFNYKYRVRVRSRRIGRADLLVSAFSDVAQAGPWG